MIDWILIGAIFNAIYFGFGLDMFVMKVTLKNIKDIEENYKSFLDVETEENLERIKKECEQYEQQVHHSPLSMALDLIIFPVYILVLLFALVNYLILRNKE